MRLIGPVLVKSTVPKRVLRPTTARVEDGDAEAATERAFAAAAARDDAAGAPGNDDE